jgi:hypothetical protein
MLFILPSCGMHDFIGKLPDHEFKSFEYHRVGGAGSTHIVATDSVKVGDMIEIGHVDINADYGPMLPKFVIKLEGYKK